LLADVFDRMAAPIYEQQQELNARLSAQRFLLEIAYANTFEGNAHGLDRLMDELIRLTRVAPTKAGPMQDDDATELQARIATHLLRFQEAVQARIASGRKV
jgi:hypothetical protein